MKRLIRGDGLEWTAVYSAAGGPSDIVFELVHAPGHSRVTFTTETAGGQFRIEVHVVAPEGYRRLPWSDQPAWDLVVCRPDPVQPDSEVACVEVPESAPEGVPHVFDVVTDRLIASAVGLVELRRSVGVVESVGPGDFQPVYGLARLTSPFGDLDCALLAEADKGIEGYEGREPAFNDGALCVDENGLLVTPPQHLQTLALQSLELGAPADAGRYPASVQPYSG